MFKFTEEQLAKYSGKTPPFGIIGAPTYKRTYSRPLYDENGEQYDRETYLQTISRVIEGNVNLGMENGDPTATPEWAEEALEYMFNFAVIPPGRGLWMLGTEYAQKRGGDALNNCWYTAVRPTSYENMEMFRDQPYIYSHPEDKMPSFPFVFMFDRAMLGGGVGFGTQKRNLEQMPRVTSRLNLKIFLHHNHPDWMRIVESEEWDRIKGHITTSKDVAEKANEVGNYIFTTDDREGWDVSVRESIDAHFTSEKETELVIDLSRIRAYNTEIKGFGGTASGPLPLITALIDTNNVLNDRVGKNMRSVDALDIMNLLGRCVVAGNVRRTALIALGDADDSEYVDAKNYKTVLPIMEKDENGYTIWEENKWGRMIQARRPFDEVVQELYEEELIYALEECLMIDPTEDQKYLLFKKAEEKARDLFDMAFNQENHRWASNNSVYTHEMFDDHHFIAAGIIANGEPGIVNEWLAKNFGRIKDGYQKSIDGDAEGTNPCGEISLEPSEPCNLVEFVPYMADKAGLDHKRGLEIATQYVYRITFAKYMWAATQRVIAKNRRVGVSITGAQDYYLTKYGHYAVKGFKDGDITQPEFHQNIVDELDEWYNIVKFTNLDHARLMNSTPSIKLTTNKPSGTVAKMPGVASGIHWHYSAFMIQRIRFHETDPNLKAMEMCGFPIEKAQKEPNTVVVEFPIKNPNADHPNFRGAIDIPLEEQIANQYLFAYAWADNAVSATLTFKHDETDKIETLLKAYNNRIKSTSLLPYTGHGYVQAPWEPITEEEYEKRVKELKMSPDEAYKHVKLTNEPSDEELDSECIGGACPAR